MENHTEKEHNTPALIQTAIQIVEYRAETSSNKEYLGWKYDERYKIDAYTREGIFSTNGLNGTLGEAFFLEFCNNFDIPCTISTGDQDLEGIDFFLGCFPIDVTTNPRGINYKVRPRRYTTLFLPKYIGQKSIIDIDKTFLDEEYILSYIKTGKHKHFEFFQDLISINEDILKKLSQEITQYQDNNLFTNSGINNEKNLRTILDIIKGT